LGERQGSQSHFNDLNLSSPLKVPDRTVVLDRHGIAVTRDQPSL